MTQTITNYDGGITTTPQMVVSPATVAELQAVLRDAERYPSPVRAMGSFHSLTPCPSSTGTVVRMSRMSRILAVDGQGLTVTAQAGIQLADAAAELRKQGLQFHLNIEIGNATLGSLASCHSKDAMDAVEFGQVSSYVTRIKWVDPSGELREASEEDDAELLRLVRSSYGLCGVVYEVTLRVKPLEIVKFDYRVHDTFDLTQQRVDDVVAANEAMVAWTIGGTTIVQTRNRTTRRTRSWLALVRRWAWTFLGAFIGRNLRYVPTSVLRNLLESLWLAAQKLAYRTLSVIGGFSLYGPDKIMDYKETPSAARYAFTFWAFPLHTWVENLRAYVEFSEDHFRRYGFRCNMPLGSYFIKKDEGSLLSYTHDGDTLSLDPIHSYREEDEQQWYRFLREFNAWAHERGGIPLLNQSPFVEREHVVAAFGDRWKRFSEWVREVDPHGRMRNEFFADLLVE
ncbi:MAG: FAD-binding oxidoreductase [Actinomycetota bacterium]|nr:FAD-binding oxidoreductase [Actinomycetota bacterium]